MKTSDITIETENLLLRPIGLEYAGEIFKEFTSDITVYMYPKSPERIEETIKFIESAMKDNEKGRDFTVAVLHKQTKEYLGGAGIHKIDTKTPELGIWIKKSAHGHGYGKEAVVALKKWADKNVDYEYILYPVVDENYASRRIPELLGGKVVREFDKKNMSGKKWHFIEYRIYPVQTKK